MADYKSKAELQAENNILRARGRVDSWTKIGHSLIWAVTIIVCMYFASVIGLAWAGKKTDANINIKADVKALANMDHKECDCPETEVVTELPAYAWAPGLLGLIFGLMGIAYGRGQSNLRRDVIERFHPYQEKLEKGLDERRSSSGLTSRGDTRPEDK